MGALFDKAEKDDLAAREPLIGAPISPSNGPISPQPSTTARGSPPSPSTTRFWLRHTGTKRLAGSAARSTIHPVSRRRSPARSNPGEA